MYGLAAALDALVLAVLFLRVAKDDQQREDTATPEMWERSLSFYKHETAARQGATAPVLHRSGLRPETVTDDTSAIGL